MLTKKELLVVIGIAAIVNVSFLYALTYRKNVTLSLKPKEFKGETHVDQNQQQLQHGFDAKIASMCVGLGVDDDMDKLLLKRKQIFISMSAKASGTTIAGYARDCVKGGSQF